MSAGGGILVIGADGMLGTAIAAELRRRGRPFTAPGLPTIDLSRPDLAARAVASLRPAAVVNLAAFTDVGRCEAPEVREEVFLVNRDGPGALALACVFLRIPFVHVSTDYVFDGTATRSYVETDPPHPIQVYGQSKLEGERAVLEAYPGALIVRISTLFGPGERPRPHYVDAILAQVRTKSRVEVVETPTSSPTYAPDVAPILLDLIDAGASGIFHAVNDGGCSRLDYARAISEEAGFGGRVEIVGKPEPPGGMRRPLYSVLDTGKLALYLGRRLRPWREALRDYLRTHRGVAP